MDNLSSFDRRKTMQAVKSSRTSLERSFASQLASRGIRGWKCNFVGVSGKPDFAFPREKIALFIDGCFWHGCWKCQKPLPVANAEYWFLKIERNKKRAKKVGRELRSMGWIVLRFWEHDLKEPSLRPKLMHKVLNSMKKNS
ncbi:MAG TPA: very short patch repair endonuclease [Anaerolineales bacterium]|nr:very short patch repair endonuclease [Anaerolineales bacterium]HRQ91909.1 very short patch repair endonuclease [Anaerolineales bacterium]